MTFDVAVDRVLASVSFQHPVTHEDCAHVRDALRAATSATMIEVHHQRDKVLVHVEHTSEGVPLVCRRTVEIKNA